MEHCGSEAAAVVQDIVALAHAVSSAGDALLRSPCGQPAAGYLRCAAVPARSECRRAETGCLEGLAFAVHCFPALQSAAREAFA